MISVITALGNRNKFETALLPSLHKTNSVLQSNGFNLLDLIKIDGSKFNNIAEAYNDGLKKSNYKIKVFIHDDIDLLNPNWVFKLLYAFANNPKCGLIGLVGTEKVNNFDNWWTAGEQYIYGSQLYREEKLLMNFKSINAQGKFDIECIDGCFMATNQNILFDTNLEYDGFLTAYEHDYCKQFKSLGYDIGLINHLSWHDCVTQGKIRNKIIFESYRKKWGIS